MDKCLYSILEIKPNSSTQDIRKAYFKLAKKYHPDKNNSPDATEKFQQIQSAYEILINDKSREEYSKMGSGEKVNFIKIIESIIKKDIDMKFLKEIGLKISEYDYDCIKSNIFGFFKNMDFFQILNLFTKGNMPNNFTPCFLDTSATDTEIDIEKIETFWDLPIKYLELSKTNIKIDLSINIVDIGTKRKIKVIRQIDGKNKVSNLICNIEKKFIIFKGQGDKIDDNIGDLIVRTVLPSNITWYEDNIIHIKDISLYEMIYGLDIDLGKTINNWVPSRDGFDVKIDEKVWVKLVLKYEHSEINQAILKEYFS